jgi:hypothetical protein
MGQELIGILEFMGYLVIWCQVLLMPNTAKTVRKTS